MGLSLSYNAYKMWWDVAIDLLHDMQFSDITLNGVSQSASILCSLKKKSLVITLNALTCIYLFMAVR